MKPIPLFLAVGLCLLPLSVPANPPLSADTFAARSRPDEPALSDSNLLAQQSGVTRCWQYGRMVFESRAYSPVASSGTRLIARGVRADGPSLYVADLQSGYCLIEVMAR